MKIGLITNLIHDEKFVLEELGYTNSEKLMRATGGNTGNVAFVHSVKNLLADDFGIVYWGDNAEAVNKAYDLIVICCANQIGSHVDLGRWSEKLEEFGLPVVLIGLGAQSNKIGEMPEVPEGTLRFLDVVNKLRVSKDFSNIITRGDFSSSVLKYYGFESSPYGCPSLLTSPNVNLGSTCLKNQDMRKYPRIMVPGGNPWHTSYVLESKLVEIVNHFNGEYVLQHPDIIFKILLDDDFQLSEDSLNVLQKTFSNFKSIDDIKSWLIANSVFFADAHNWLNYSRKFSSAIGPRYHGIAIPIQVGVPGRVIAIDSRTEELSLTTGIPFVRYEEIVGLNYTEIAGWSKWSVSEAENFDYCRRRNSLNYIQFFGDNNMRIKEHVVSISKSIGK